MYDDRYDSNGRPNKHLYERDGRWLFTLDYFRYAISLFINEFEVNEENVVHEEEEKVCTLLWATLEWEFAPDPTRELPPIA